MASTFKKSLLTVFHLFSYLVSFSQSTGILKGVVLDAQSKEAITGANVYLLSDKGKGNSTNDHGNFQITLPAGNQKLICSYLSYASDTFEVVIEAGKITTYNVLLTPETKELNTIVVSAGKYEQKLEDITVSMEVLKPKLIEEKNTTNVTQILEQVPGLNILDEEPQIRGGSGFAFGVGSRVATMVDGIPLMSGDAGRADWAMVPIENLNQVEVIKGASSVQYGSSALSGTINFLTNYPTAPHETKVRLYSGFYSTPSNAAAKWWSGLANFSGLMLNYAAKTNQFDWIVGGFLMYDHGFIGPPLHDPTLPFEQDSLTEKDVADRSGRFTFSFRYRPQKIDGLSLGINGSGKLEHSNFSLVWGDDSSKIYRAFPQTITLTNDAEMYLDPFVTYFAPSGLKHELKSRIYLDDSQNTNGQSTTNSIYYVEYQVSKDLAKFQDAHMTAGVLTNQTFSHAKLYIASGTPDNKWQNYAAYIQFDKKFWNQLNVSLGFRGEYFQINKTENVAKPIFRAGANWKLGQATYLRVSYGQGYRYPTIAEKFIYTSVGGITIYPNPELQPETSWNTELGVKQGFKIGKFYGFADGAAFWQEYKNTIEYNYALWSPDSAGFKFVNTGESRVRGFDFSLEGGGKISNSIGITIIAGYTYALPQSANPDYVYATENPGEGITPKKLSYASTSTDTTNNILKYRFQHIAKVDAEISYKAFRLGGSVRYYSFMQNIDKTFYDLDKPYLLPTGIIHYREVHDHGTWVADARVSYALGKYYTAALVINNLFNLEYSLRPVKAEPMRTIAIQLRANI